MGLIFRISIVRSDIEAHQTGEQARGGGQQGDRAAVGRERRHDGWAPARAGAGWAVGGQEEGVPGPDRQPQEGAGQAAAAAQGPGRREHGAGEVQAAVLQSGGG